MGAQNTDYEMKFIDIPKDSIYEYLKDVLPRNKTEEQQIRMLGDLLKSMSKESIIKAEGRTWYIVSQL